MIFRMKKIGAAMVVIAATLTLAACGKLNFNSNSSSGGSKGSSYTTTGTVDDSMYQGVIKGGRYQTSSARGLMIEDNTQGDNTYNIRSMENGLLDISKKQFSTNKYVFQEGQLLSTATARKWLGRKSKSNAEGLNPVDNGKTGENDRNPMYLQTILEQDYMTQNGNSLSLGGISIALGMNEYDYYTKKNYGPTFTTHVSQTKLTSEGRAMAKEVVARLRQMNGVGKNTPIVVALYKNAAQDALIGGTYFDSVISKSGTSLGNWNKVNQQNQVLPTVENEKPINTTVNNDFSNFKSQVQNFFPTMAGITAQTHYENGSLSGLNIAITTQFYGETEIDSFTQFVATSAQRYLPSGAQIEITIKSASGDMQAFVARNSGDKGFYTHVFGSY